MMGAGYFSENEAGTGRQTRAAKCSVIVGKQDNNGRKCKRIQQSQLSKETFSLFSTLNFIKCICKLQLPYLLNSNLKKDEG